MQNKLNRQLATVMFSDMVGYSKFMDEDESKALSLRKQMEGMLKELIPKYGGQIIQYYGDGALSTFESSVKAVECAGALQTIFRTEQPTVPVRIGIHTGDIAVDEEGAYGESVNIASRIESFAVPGSVFFSAKVFDDLKNHPDIQTIRLGEFNLKNIQFPLTIFALQSDHVIVPPVESLEGKGERLSKSIAVLPFVNMSPDPENEYFSDGISEEILNSLTKVDALRVTARTSSFAYKGRSLDVRKIGKELGVEAVLEGSVRKAGSRVRITAQLIDTGEGFHLFSDTYDRTLDDIFAVQDEIAQKIANQLRETLGLNEVAQGLVDIPTQNMEAYEFYLKGTFHWNTYTPVGAQKAIQFFKQAIQLDPSFSKAMAELSFCYSFLGATGRMPTAVAFSEAMQNAQDALKINSNEVDALCALGLAQLFFKWDLVAAQKSFDKAQLINPGSLTFLQTYALFLNAKGQFEEALKFIRQCIKIDPLSVMPNVYLAEALMLNRKFKEGLIQVDKTLEMFPNYIFAVLVKVFIYIQLEEYEKALSVVDAVDLPLEAKVKELLPVKGYILSLMDRKEESRAILSTLSSIQEQQPESLFFEMSMVYYGLGDIEGCFNCLFQAADQRVGGLIFMLHNPNWRALKEYPQYEELIRRMNVKE